MNRFEFLVNNLALNMDLMAQLAAELLIIFTYIHKRLGVLVHRSKRPDCILKKENVLFILGLYLRLEALEAVINGQDDENHPQGGDYKESRTLLKNGLKIVHPVNK